MTELIKKLVLIERERAELAEQKVGEAVGAIQKWKHRAELYEVALHKIHDNKRCFCRETMGPCDSCIAGMALNDSTQDTEPKETP